MEIEQKALVERVKMEQEALAERVEIEQPALTNHLFRQAVVQATYNMLLLDKRLILIEDLGGEKGTSVEDYWSVHTVLDDMPISAQDSIESFSKRESAYPHFHQMACLDDLHEGEVILDYGCGPGHDLTGFFLNSKAEKLIGMDVSVKSLTTAQFRMALHGAKPQRVELLQISDCKPVIPLKDKAVDFINCQGVLMNTSYPVDILKEFRRVLADKGWACVMVYNRSSVWYHLYAAYQIRFHPETTALSSLVPELSNMTVDTIFSKSTDGLDCPKSDCYTPEVFCSMCHEAGFAQVEYVGGYPELTVERASMDSFMKKALEDDRLEEEHKAFLREITLDADGCPMRHGKLASIGGVYYLR